MRKPSIRIICLPLLLGFIFNTEIAAQNTLEKDSLVGKEILAMFSKSLSLSNTYSGLEFSLEIKKQLKDYNLNIYNASEMKEGRFLISSKGLGKSYLEESYNIFKTDLSSFLPKPVDITLLPCKPNF